MNTDENGRCSRDCPVCRGGGMTVTYTGSYFGPPDGFDCLECSGTGQVPVTECECCDRKADDIRDLDGIAVGTCCLGEDVTIAA